jgi:DNA-binding MarR family transcriptional regulator
MAPIGPSTSRPSPADQEQSVATRRNPFSLRSARHGNRLGQTRSAAAGFGDTTAAQGRVFARIDPDGTRLTNLAERALITKQTAGFLVDQLERAGYVRRVPDPRDARARLVQIAERGRAAVEVARQTEAKVEAEWTAHLGEEATTQLRHALARLRDITDPYR